MTENLKKEDLKIGTLLVLKKRENRYAPKLFRIQKITPEIITLVHNEIKADIIPVPIEDENAKKYYKVSGILIKLPHGYYKLSNRSIKQADVIYRTRGILDEDHIYRIFNEFLVNILKNYKIFDPNDKNDTDFYRYGGKLNIPSSLINEFVDLHNEWIIEDLEDMENKS